MLFPLEELIKFQGNMYEITCAASRRSYQLSMIKSPDVEDNDGKVVSYAAAEVFRGDVKYRMEEESEIAPITGY
ncbi:DNA-directed RNA polymerase subunit omega [Spirochaetia bacterium]|nr:DNA-directed RNA polymerase subunit omega [Spirochaetia bacterium]